MPVQTSVKPKIKEEEATEGPPSPCADCGTTAKHLVVAYVVEKEVGAPPTVCRKDLCGTCLVGHDVAVRRDGKGGMCFGEVKAYDGSLLRPFLMSFLDGDEEWTEVSPAPSTEYLDSLGIASLPVPLSSPTKILSQASIGSFSSSSFSIVSPNIGGIFPLFDDAKLPFADATPSRLESTPAERCLDASLSSLDGSIYSDEEGNIEVRPSTMSTLVSRPKRSQSKSSHKKKPSAPRSPVMWTPSEDKNLLRVVDSFLEQGLPLKWADIAEECPGRNGKQCRERYGNHLSTSLTKSPWTPQEDATVFSLFFRIGKKWSQIAKFFTGRTDNGTKNRFHHLRRRLNKDLQKKGQQYSTMSRADDDDESIATINSDSAEVIKQRTKKILSILSKESKGNASSGVTHWSPKLKGYVFGPFVASEETQCKRCGLFVPSAQTGKAICTKTAWCEACTMIPPYVTDELLLECLELRVRDGAPINV